MKSNDFASMEDYFGTIKDENNIRTGDYLCFEYHHAMDCCSMDHRCGGVTKVAILFGVQELHEDDFVGYHVGPCHCECDGGWLRLWAIIRPDEHLAPEAEGN